MSYTTDINPGVLPYLGEHVDHVMTTLAPDLAIQLHEERMRQGLTVRELAKRISVIDVAEALRRRLAHGHAEDLSGLRISYQVVNRVDDAGMRLRYGMAIPPVEVAVPGYALICRWLGVAPAFEKPGIRAFYVSKWLPVYELEMRRQGEG